jgi:hypothetical protein
LYDDEPDKIRRDFTTGRFGISDVLRFINGFNDGQQDFNFVNAADGQSDRTPATKRRITPGMPYGKAKQSLILDGW